MMTKNQDSYVNVQYWYFLDILHFTTVKYSLH